MQATERIEAIVRQCRASYYAFPEPLITAICQYVSGEGSLAQVQQAVLETAGMSVGYEQEFSTAIKRLAFARVDTIKRGSYVYDDLKEQDERLIKLGDVPPIIFSEIAADVQTFAAAGEYTEDWEKKVW